MSPRIFIDYKDLAFYFYSNENNEPIHVHVAHKRPAAKAAKFWVGRNGVTLADSGSFSKKELNDIEFLLDSHLDIIIAQWSRTFGTANFYDGPKQGDLRSMDLD